PADAPHIIQSSRQKALIVTESSQQYEPVVGQKNHNYFYTMNAKKSPVVFDRACWLDAKSFWKRQDGI
ncbi:MAG: hypothetical protein PVH01_13700, partial [Desulfobacterales bacterium]